MDVGKKGKEIKYLFDLLELVNAEDTPGIFPGRTGFFPEASREPCISA